MRYDMQQERRVPDLQLVAPARQAAFVFTAPTGPQWQLAHQYGWDEIILFAVPIVLALLAVRWVEKRSKRKKEDEPRPPG